MRRTYFVPFSRAGLAGLMAALVLLCLPGTSIAGGASDTSSTPDAASLLQYGAGYGEAEGAPHVREVQRTLRGLGWQPGPVDGLYGPRTRAAVTRFQTAARVAADGIVGPQTRRALTRANKEPLRRGAGFAQPDGSPRVRALQVRLQRHLRTRRPLGCGGPTGWLASLGTVDYAGGLVVEIVSGSSALALALVLGPRIGFKSDAMRPHNLPFVSARRRIAVVRLVRLQRGLSAPPADGKASVVFSNTYESKAGQRSRLRSRRAAARWLR